MLPSLANKHVLCCVLSRSGVSDSLDHMDCSAPGRFSRQEYWNRLPCPPPGDLLNPGIEPRSPTLQMDSLPSEPRGKPKKTGVGSLSFLHGKLPNPIDSLLADYVGDFQTSQQADKCYSVRTKSVPGNVLDAGKTI